MILKFYGDFFFLGEQRQSHWSFVIQLAHGSAGFERAYSEYIHFAKTSAWHLLPLWYCETRTAVYNMSGPHFSRMCEEEDAN